jgi:suppressor of tumorigenicity protein 13
MGDNSTAPDDDASAKSQEAFTKGREALGSRDFAGAIASFTEAIKLDATGTRPFAMRAKAHIKLKQPNAAKKDADAVLAINPDNAAGYKWRGKANAMLGNWINAFEDLSKAMSIDFDDEAADLLPDVKKNALKMKEDVRTLERLTKDRDMAERLRRNKKAKREYAKANTAPSPSSGGGMPGGFPGGGGMPDMGGMGGGMPGGMPPGMAGLFSDPDVMASMSDPDIMAAMADMQGNPANLMKHMSNPKVAAFFQKMQGKMGGMGGGMPGGMGGGMPDMGGMGGGMPGGMPDMGFEDVTDEPAPPAAAQPPSSMEEID